MLARLPQRSRYYKIICNDCDLIVAIRRIKASIHAHPSLRPLHSQTGCPFCQSRSLEEQEMLAEEHQRIEKNWDLLGSGDVDAHLAKAACDIDDGEGEIDLSQL